MNVLLQPVIPRVGKGFSCPPPPSHHRGVQHRPLLPTLQRASTQRGFTLLEVLVALGIAATALVSLYTLAGQLLKGSTALEVRQAALWCADNHLVTVSLGQFAPPLGETTHPCAQLGREYTVKRLLNATPNPMFRRIELAVYAKDAVDNTERLAFLATVLPQNAGQ
jgi:general secretion pathway protein I